MGGSIAQEKQRCKKNVTMIIPEDDVVLVKA
jgi:hypothetical protein